MNKNPHRRSKAVSLLVRVIASGWFPLEEVADALVVDPRTLGRYMSGDLDMPLDRQLCLARFLTERVPPLARQGHNLLGQVSAAIRFSRSTTELHKAAPASFRTT